MYPPPRPQKGMQLLVVYLLLLVAFVGGALMDRLGWLPGAVPQPEGLQPTFDEAWNLVDQYYVDRKAVQPKKMTQGAINGMLNSLGDIGHTTYLTREIYQEQMKQLKGEFEGIGAYLDPNKQEPTIMKTIPGSPAQKAGLKPGDIIQEVNHQQVAKLPHVKITALIKGPAGTSVNLQILRPGVAKPLDFTIKRGKIDFPTVTWALLPGTPIAHIALQDFGTNTDAQLRKAIEEAYQKGVKGLIVDIRYNAGGLKDTAVAVTSEFLPAGDTVFIERNAGGAERSIKVDRRGVATSIPVVVLINEDSASSSEIFAGALKDYDRAKLVGTKTYGTGTVLKPFPLSDGSVVLLAVAEWLTPKGHQIWHKGIEPDYVVELPPKVAPLFPYEEGNMDEAALRKSRDTQLLKAIAVLEDQLGIKPTVKVSAKKE